jgi:hypothetical protein
MVWEGREVIRGDTATGRGEGGTEFKSGAISSEIMKACKGFV